MSDGLILELDEFILEGVIKFVEKHGVDVSKQLGLEIFENTDSIWYGNLLDEAIKRIAKKSPAEIDEAWKAYQKATVQANEAYEKAKAEAREACEPMPFWEPYFKAADQAWRVYRKAKASE